MAVTPQSIVRSPLLLLALLVSTGIAVFGMTMFFGSCPSQQTTKTVECDFSPQKIAPTNVDAGVCSFVTENFADDPELWSEKNWIDLAFCLEKRDKSLDVVRVADRGLNYHPHSEVLYNVKAYHELELKRYDAAVTTLETGLQMVTPSSGVMENNLAWAALWESRRIDALTARELYESSLRRDPSSCEAVHTGMWVEYAVATKYNGRIRGQAIHNYTSLRNRYDRCINRIDYGDEKVLFEILGAGVLDHEVSKLRMLRELETGRINRGVANDAQLVERAMAEHSERFGHVDVNKLCAEASPVRGAAHRCRNLVRSELFKAETAQKPEPHGALFVID